MKILERSDKFKEVIKKYTLSQYPSKDNPGIFSSYEYSKWISENSPEKLIIQHMLKSLRNYKEVIEVIKGILKE